ncbi:MAG: hypothetical protein EGP73_02835, partial [Alistipes indistinctus]|nr:hypothetical protein [Alistipes indistinctus]
RLVSDEEMHRHPERNTLTGLCVDAVVPAAYGAHPSQCFGCYDYDGTFTLSGGTLFGAGMEPSAGTQAYIAVGETSPAQRYGASALFLR